VKATLYDCPVCGVNAHTHTHTPTHTQAVAVSLCVWENICFAQDADKIKITQKKNKAKTLPLPKVFFVCLSPVHVCVFVFVCVGVSVSVYMPASNEILLIFKQRSPSFVRLLLSLSLPLSTYIYLSLSLCMANTWLLAKHKMLKHLWCLNFVETWKCFSSCSFSPKTCHHHHHHHHHHSHHHHRWLHYLSHHRDHYDASNPWSTLVSQFVNFKAVFRHWKAKLFNGNCKIVQLLTIYT